MTGFEGEYLLRRYAEDALRLRTYGAFAECSRVLSTLELVPRETVNDVRRRYGRARSLREQGYWDYDDRDDAGEPAGVAGYRVFACDQDVETPTGTVHVRYVALRPGSTHVAASVRFQQSGRSGGSHGSMLRHHLGPSALDVTDDAGTRVSLHFSGGGSDDGLDGRFSSSESLSADTRWIEIAGSRIDLVARDSGASVHVEPRAQTLRGRAADYLRFRTAYTGRGHWEPSVLPVTLDLLVRSGAVDADDPLIADARAALRGVRAHPAVPGVFPGHAPRARGGRRPKTAEGQLAVGVTTSVFDGIALCVLVVSAHRDHLGIEVEGAGSTGDITTDHEPEPYAAFEVVDDLDNHYVGDIGEWHSGSEGFGGRLRFEPGLDARATRIEMTVTTPRQRATITIPLRWAP